jgi:predicted MFS family arabinose efflux permease
MATKGEAQAPPRRWWSRTQIHALGLLMLINLSNYLDRGIIGVLQQPIKEDLRLSDVQLGLMSGLAFSLLYSVSGLSIARLAERMNRIRLLVAATIVWSVMTIFCGLSTSYIRLLIARVGVGVGEGACTPICHSLVSDIFGPRERGKAMSFITLMVPMTQIISPIIGATIAVLYGWRAAFLVVGMFGLPLALILLATVPEPRHGAMAAHAAPVARSRFLADLGLLVRNRAFVLLFCASAFMSQGIGGTSMFSASYFVRQFHLGLGQAGLITGIGLGGGGLLGTLAGGYLADRFAGARGRSYPFVCAAGALISSLFFFLTFSAHVWPLAMAAMLIANFATDLKNGPNLAAAQNLAPPHMRATASAVIMIALIVLGTGMGPILVGTVSDMVARDHFPALYGSFASVCHGGAAPGGSVQALVEACHAASAAGLHTAMFVPCVCFLLAGMFFILSGLSIREEMR